MPATSLRSNASTPAQSAAASTRRSSAPLPAERQFGASASSSCSFGRERAHLAELAHTRDEGHLHVGVARLERPVQSAQVVAIGHCKLRLVDRPGSACRIRPPARPRVARYDGAATPAASRSPPPVSGGRSGCRWAAYSSRPLPSERAGRRRGQAARSSCRGTTALDDVIRGRTGLATRSAVAPITTGFGAGPEVPWRAGMPSRRDWSSASSRDQTTPSLFRRGSSILQ